MYTHCMLDLETMGVYPGAALLSIGAVKFLPGAVQWPGGFKRNIILQSCLDVGLVVDPRTAEWWQSQSPEARAALWDPEPVSLADALLSFRSWYLDENCERVWSHGASADVVWIEAAFRACNVPVPWGYRDARDTRTLHDLVENNIFVRSQWAEPEIAHCALQDALAQARNLSRIMAVLVERLGSEVPDYR